MKFPEKLYQLRKAAGMTQSDLAEKLEVSRQAVSRWEMGTATPEVETLIAISDLFNVSLDFLLRDEPVTVDPCVQLPVQPKFWDYVPRYWWAPLAIGVLIKLAYYASFLVYWLTPPGNTSSTTASADGALFFLRFAFSVPMWNLYANIAFCISGLCFLWALVKWMKARK